MAVALLFARSNRALPSPSPVGFQCWPRFTPVSTWMYNSRFIVPFTGRSKSSSFLDCGSHPGIQQQHGFFSNRSARHVLGLDKNRTGMEDLRLSNQDKPKWLHSGLPALDPQLTRGLGSSSSGSVALGDELQRLCEQGQLDRALAVLLRMDNEGIVPSAHIYGCLLKVCAKRKALTPAKRVSAHLAKHGLQGSKFIGESMVSTLVRCGGLDDALQVFHNLTHQTAFAWTALISGHTVSGQGQEALRLYQWMQEKGVQPTAHTFVQLLKACGNIRSLKEGKRIHADVLKYGFEDDVFVGTCLVDMYGKCGSIVDAYRVFDQLTHRDVVTWNALLTAYAQHGQAEKAVELYEQMQQEGVSPNDRTFVGTLQACGMLAEKEAGGGDGQSTKVKALEKGRVVHADAQRKGYHSDVFVGSTLVSMYGKCGSIVDAHDVFCSLHQRNVVSWNAMLSAYVDKDQPETALQLYKDMRNEGVVPDDRTFVSVIQACTMVANREEGVVVDGQSTKIQSLKEGRALHADAKRDTYDTDVFVGSTLIHMYGTCGSIADAQKVFLGLSYRDAISWNSMLAAYTHQGLPDQALLLYDEMLNEGVSPNIRTFVSSLQACGLLAEGKDTGDEHSAKSMSLEKGRAIHAVACRKGYDSDVFVGNTLVSMYGKCGSILDAQKVFDKLSQRDVVSWNTILVAYVEEDQAERALQLYEQMEGEGTSPDVRTFVTALQACGMFAEKRKDAILDGQSNERGPLVIGKKIHADAQRKGYDTDVYVSNTLVSMYGKCGSIMDAQNVFDGLSQRHVGSWNVMLAAYIEHGKAEAAWNLYNQMQEEGVSPESRTFVSIVQACGMLAEKGELVDGASSEDKYLEMGKAIHADIRAKGFNSDVFVGSALVSMYRKCGSILEARKVFDGLIHRDVVSWNAILMGYLEQGDPESVLQLYDRMLEEDAPPNVRTFLTAAQACGMLAEKDVDERSKCLVKGKAIHAEARSRGYTSDVFIASTLVSMYGKCGSMVDAKNVFDSISQQDVVSWNAMVAAYTQVGQAEKALQLYRQMEQEGASPDAWTFVSVLQACGILAEEEEENGQSIKEKSLEEGRTLHKDVQRKGYESDIFVCTTLVSMYGKCGSIVDAQNVFDGLSQRGLVPCNAMLAAYAQQGQGQKALQLWRQMQEQGISANEITVVCLLQACSSTGSLAALRHIHDTVVPTKNDLSPLLASALINSYGRCASMQDARTVFNALPKPDGASWNALVAGYARQGSCVASLQCFEEMQVAGVKPNEVTFLSLLSACSHAGLLDKGVEYFESMSRDHGITPGIEHYASMVDLFGRAGCFTRVEDLLSTMPMQPDLGMWLCLLAACQKHGMVQLGKQAFDAAVRLQPRDSAAYVLMSNIYSDAGMWDQAMEMHAYRQKERAKKKPGQSWIELEHEVHSFAVGDEKHFQQAQLNDLLGKITLGRKLDRTSSSTMNNKQTSQFSGR